MYICMCIAGYTKLKSKLLEGHPSSMILLKALLQVLYFIYNKLSGLGNCSMRCFLLTTLQISERKAHFYKLY